ncbi:MAG: ABC transporter ATP-binding protein [Deltaproteobacteria bacterium]|nr:MAG: ABC transporter ATP-binding protein [Deltaproteobacteria bacterium]
MNDSQNSAAAPLGHYLWKLATYARPYKKRIALGLFTNAAARGFDLLPLVIIGMVVDRLTGGNATPGSWFLLKGLLVLITFLGLAFFQSLSDYTWASIAQLIRHDLRTSLYEHLQRLEASFFEERQVGDIMSVVVADVDNLENFLSDATTSIIRILITFVGTYGILLWLDWRLAMLLFAPLPFVVIAIKFFATKVQPKYRRARQAVGSINSIVENNIQGMGVIQAYTSEAYQAERVRERSGEYRDAAISAAKERAKFIPLIYAIAGFSFAALIGGGAWLTFAGHGPSVGDYTSFILFSMRLVMPLFVFGILINQIQRCEASAHRIVSLLDTKPGIADMEGAKKLEEAPRSLGFNGVHFAYPNREPVIHGVDFELGLGKMIGIVGPTGAGKSTLIKLLLRYYEPGEGRITINGSELRDLTLESLRTHIGYVSQDAFLFAGTIEENIKLGAHEASYEKMREAARIAGAEEFILDLPKGYETEVGERGMKLSGGQRQRISLARALLRDPAILILDEATSAVDTRTEEVIQQGLQEFRDGRMTLAVAHRLSTVRASDEILVLVDGVVVERGSHDDLIAKGSVYHDLWAVQSGTVGENVHNGNGRK